MGGKRRGGLKEGHKVQRREVEERGKWPKKEVKRRMKKEERLVISAE